MFDVKLRCLSKGPVGKIRSIERSVVQNANGLLQCLIQVANDAIEGFAFVGVSNFCTGHYKSEAILALLFPDPLVPPDDPYRTGKKTSL